MGKKIYIPREREKERERERERVVGTVWYLVYVVSVLA